jgi:hypothetical protein
MQYAAHASDVQFYVPPDVVVDTPSDLSPAQFVTVLEAPSAPPSHARAVHTLQSAVQAFLGSPEDPLLLILGEAGLGKSLFTWMTARRLAGEAGRQGGGPSGGRGSSSGKAHTQDAPWLPVVLELKEIRMSELLGLLPRCGGGNGVGGASCGGWHVDDCMHVGACSMLCTLSLLRCAW